MSSTENWDRAHQGDFKTARDIKEEARRQQMVKGSDYQKIVWEMRELIEKKKIIQGQKANLQVRLI